MSPRAPRTVCSNRSLPYYSDVTVESLPMDTFHFENTIVGLDHPSFECSATTRDLSTDLKEETLEGKFNIILPRKPTLHTLVSLLPPKSK
jgi:hypothetical protein